MKTYKTLLFALLISLMFTGCENMISEVDAPATEPKLVVYSVLSPQSDVIKVRLNKSRPLYTRWNYENNNGYLTVNNATVKISDGVTAKTLLFDSADDHYKIDSSEFRIIPGNRYFLEITTPEGDKATAECTIPSGTHPAIELISIDTQTEYGETVYMVNFRFRDTPGSNQNYYVAPAYIFSEEISGTEYIYEIGLSKGDAFFTDKNKDGEYFIFRSSGIHSSVIGSNFEFMVFLSITGDELFHYQKSVTGFQGDNPFQEPVPIYSNIKGGLGVFSGENTVYTTIPFAIR